MGKKKKSSYGAGSNQNDILDMFWRMEQGDNDATASILDVGDYNFKKKKNEHKGDFLDALSHTIDKDIASDKKRAKKDKKRRKKDPVFIFGEEYDDEDEDDVADIKPNFQRLSEEDSASYSSTSQSIPQSRPVATPKPIQPQEKRIITPPQNPQPVKEQQKPVEKPRKVPECRTTTLKLYPDLKRGVIDDGIIASGIILSGSSITTENPEVFSEENEDMLMQNALYCLEYACIMKHPAAIIPEDKFIDAMSHVVSHNVTKFIFVHYANKMFCYKIQGKLFDTLANAIGYGDESVSVSDYVRNAAVIASSVGSVENGFYFGDEGYIDLFMKNYNNYKEFIDDFFNDVDTEVSDDPTSESSVCILEFDEFATNIMSFIDAIIDSDDDDDDSDFDNNLLDNDAYDTDEFDSDEEDDEDDEDLDEDDEDDVDLDEDGYDDEDIEDSDDIKDLDEADEDDEDEDNVTDEDLLDETDSDVDIIHADAPDAGSVINTVRREGH